MDSKDGKKKESIDEILSDLNGLLNKMPSILDGIRMPEIKPVEFAAPEPAPKPAAEVPAPAQEAAPAAEEKAAETASPAPEVETPLPVFNPEKTVVLENLSGLPEGASAPEEKPAADEPLVIESFAKQAEAVKQPETGGLVPQSLGDFMFGEDAEQKPQEAAPALSQEPQAAAPEPAPEIPVLPVSPMSEEKTPEAGFIPSDAVSPETPDLSLQQPEAPVGEPEPEQPAAELKPRGGYEVTRDFGVPDIDALMQLSQDEILGRPAPEPSVEPAAEPVQEQSPEPEALKEEPSMDELAEFERQLKAAGEQGGEMENKPEEKQEKPAEEIVPEAAAPVEPAAAPGNGFEGLTIEPEASNAGPEAQPEVATRQETPGEMDLAQAASEPQPEPAPQTGGIELDALSEAGSTQQFQPAPQPEAQPEPAAQAEAPREMELSVGRPAEEKPQEDAGQGLVLEPANAFMSSQPASDSGGETLVVPPPAAAGDADKTVVYDAGSAPGSTHRSQSGDFDALAVKQTPEGIPAERVRAVMFLYAPEEKGFCAAVLAELDAICLKSAAKPMFIRRAGVKECASDMNANYILQMASDAGAIGLVCVGAIPQEKIYEVENVFTSSGGFFRHYDSASFSHSAALDLVSDLILRV